MIGTQETKRAQIANGYYQTGNGPLKILIVGSCRSLAYLNYLARWNAMSGNGMTIRFIDPFNWHWDANENLVDLEAAITAMENHPGLRAALGETEIFLHEWYQYYGMFNTNKAAAKNIYQFGLAPRLDVCFPNFHDHFVLFQEQIDMNVGGIADTVKTFETIWPPVADRMTKYGLATIEKFYEVCRKSDFPEIALAFEATWRKKRYFWTGNHVSKHFTLLIWEQLCDRFLEINQTVELRAAIADLDIFANPHTQVTQYDIDAYGLQWNCPVVPLKLP